MPGGCWTTENGGEGKKSKVAEFGDRGFENEKTMAGTENGNGKVKRGAEVKYFAIAKTMER